MTTTTTSTPNPTPATPATDVANGKGRSVTAGFSDGLGDRQLMFDPAAATSFELLHIKKEFADAPEFEDALRARVEDLRQVQHPSLATIHGVERRNDGALLLASKLVAGRRVSELVPKARGPAFALELIRLITPALAVLHKSGNRVIHGALTAERIIVTRDGRLMVVEHALGSAIESLKLSRAKLNDLGIAVPAGEHVNFDGRIDMGQLGFIALSLLLGRQLEAADFPIGVPALLDEFVMSSGSPILAAKLRGWLERAMQISPRSFPSAKEATDALTELPDDADLRVSEASMAAVSVLTPARMPAITDKSIKPLAAAKPSLAPVPPKPSLAPVPPAAERAGRREVPAPDFLSEPSSSSSQPAFRSGWLTVALAVLAGVEGVAIGVLLYTRPAEQPATTSPASHVAAVQPPATPFASPSPSPVPPSSTPLSTSPTPSPVLPKPEVTTPAPAVATAAAAATAPAGPRFGGITVTSPIELQVFKDGTLLGTTGGNIAVAEGAQNLLFVNETLGFRTSQTVTVKFGQMTNVKIGVPNGRISINAVPWADVTIDGNAAGETPIANLALPIGTHEIVFKHPQLGEKKQTVVVKVDGIVKVTQTFQPDGGGGGQR
jgi:hypothetical protein